MYELGSDWNNESYVSLHLVQELLTKAGLPANGNHSHWYPEFKIKVPIDGQKFSEKKVDFLVKDHQRYLKFLVEVKTAKSRIDDKARFQLDMYLRNSNTRFGMLIDPFTIEIYEHTEGQTRLHRFFCINNPLNIQPSADFLKLFLESFRMRTITIHTEKGGVGKTTLAVNIAYELARWGNKVLVIDLDEQANTSLYLGVNLGDKLDKVQNIDEFKQVMEEFKARKEVVDFLKSDFNSPNADYKQYIHSSSFNKFLSKGQIDVLPSSYRTKDEGFFELIGIPEKLLNKALQKSGISNSYDYVVIDTPPSSTMISRNGLYAGHYILIPSQLEYFSAFSISPVLNHLNFVQEEMNGERGKVLGIIPTMTEGGKVRINTLSREFMERMLPNINIFPEIKRTVHWAKASQERLPITKYAEKHTAARSAATQLTKLTQTIVDQIQKEEAKGV